MQMGSRRDNPRIDSIARRIALMSCTWYITHYYTGCRGCLLFYGTLKRCQGLVPEFESHEGQKFFFAKTNKKRNELLLTAESASCGNERWIGVVKNSMPVGERRTG